MKKMGLTSKGIITLAILTFFSSLPTYGGEDVANARENALSGSPIDFWGGISSLFYSRIPNYPFGWAENLLLFQTTITSVSLIMFAEVNKNKSFKFKLFFISFAYLALIFGSQQTRDGLMFSLACLSGALLFCTRTITSKWVQNLSIAVGLALIVFAFSFRPWISFSYSIIFAGWYYWKSRSKKMKKLVSAFIVLAALPSLSLSVELLARNIIDIRTIYPEQQVISMDLAAAYCWSTNPTTVRAAKDAISLMYTDNSPGTVCESFKPINWIWFSRKPILENSAIPTTFTFLTEKNEQEYKKLRSQWIALILRDPATYIQNKYMFGSQVFIAGDSRYLRLFSSNYYSTSSRIDLIDRLIGLFFLPWDVIITLHLLSMNASLILWITLLLKQYRNGKSRNLKNDVIYVCSFFLWFGATVVAYIGDNGRYTYAASLALLFSLFLYKSNSFEKAPK